MSATAENGPIEAADDERAVLGRVKYLLAESTRAPRLIGLDGDTCELPPSAARVLRQAVAALVRGHAVSVVLFARDLTTRQAAGLLNISRPYLIRLLERGEIPYTKTGTHRRIRLDDLLAYKRRRDAKRRWGLRELTRLSEDLGLYDLPAAPPAP